MDAGLIELATSGVFEGVPGAGVMFAVYLLIRQELRALHAKIDNAHMRIDNIVRSHHGKEETP